MRYIDLRSDTVTRPSFEMRKSAAAADVGDDVYGEDPTVKKLEHRVAKMFGKEAALFFPTGTMCNLTAILTWCDKRGSEIIVGDSSHIFLYEQAGASQFGGVSFRTVKNYPNGGEMYIHEIRNAIRDNDIHEPITKLICIENTHNSCGGRVLPMEFLEKLHELSIETEIPIHMDGARIWNAITALRIKPDMISKYVNSLSVCLSKGLGAPMGSLLVGSDELINKARRIRKALGGGMRQIGMMAAAGLIALDDFEWDILKYDHMKIDRIFEALKSSSPIRQPVQVLHVAGSLTTNMLYLYIEDAQKLTQYLKDRGILISQWSKKTVRLVVHRDITDEDIDNVIESLINYK
jgi:threonine aldolase